MVFSLRQTLFVGVIAQEIEVNTIQAAAEAKEHVQALGGEVQDPNWIQITGKDWLFFRATAELEGLKFRYVFYVYGGPEGTYQIICWTTTNVAEKYEPVFNEIANSFTFPQRGLTVANP